MAPGLVLEFYLCILCAEACRLIIVGISVTGIETALVNVWFYEMSFGRS